MSQHDLNIGNQLFPATRTDINNALVALASNSSGATAPNNAVANQIWYDTTTTIVKIRNEANTDWIDLFTLDQSTNKISSITSAGFTLGATAITATGDEINKLAGTAVTTTEIDLLATIPRGSLIFGDATGTNKLSKGTIGQVLTCTATDINWSTLPVAAAPAIISSGGASPVPTLETGITAGEIRNLIGAGVSDSDTTYSIQDGELSENNFTNADHTKLDGIETGATADQTNAEIRAAVDAATDSNVFTDADHSKLDGIAASANNYSHPNHSGEVTSSADGATVIADNVVDEANLKVSNAAVNGYVLTAQSANTGGLTWAAASSGGGGGVGVSQSWQTNTMNGQNTEGEPIMVFSRFTGFGNTASFQVSSDNSTWLTLADSKGTSESGDSFAGARTTVAAIIPDDHYWRITGTVASHVGNGGPNINMVLK